MKISNIQVGLYTVEKSAEFSSQDKEEVRQIDYTSVGVMFTYEDVRVDLMYGRLKRKTKIFSKTKLRPNKLLGSFYVNNVRFFLFTDKLSSVFVSSKINQFLKNKNKFTTFVFFNKLYFFGYMTNSHICNQYGFLHLGDKPLNMRVKRPLNLWKFKHLAVFSITIQDIVDCSSIHSMLGVGTKDEPFVALKHIAHKRKKGLNYYRGMKFKDRYVLIRSTAKRNVIVATQIPFGEEYKILFKIKVAAALVVSRLTPGDSINLFFEKESNRAQESGYYVFRKIVQYSEKNKLRTKNYFILDRNSSDYEKVKKQFGNMIVKKYSFKHCYLIFKSSYFVSSELSNHVINPRLYNRVLNNIIKKKPLIFLQHGIMFAKPVDNPAAKGFWKKNSPVNTYKSVVSSDLEAEQFFKMGYDPEDLIKCGLPKFDISKAQKDANKIMFMPTYRYWEEANFMDFDKVKKTSYYKLYLGIIKLFEKEGLLDRLIISSHPKFAEKIYKTFPKYKDNFTDNIDRALSEAKIFITDYSSASYDAHYRGAAVIYYWKERDYLIENYKAIPPINETNCDGKPVFSDKELIAEVRRLIKNNYKSGDIYEERYRKINEFSDNKNGERLIKELHALGVI